MRSTSEEQNRTCRRSHSRNAGPRSSPSARRSTIAARRGPLSSTSSVGITYTGGPSGRRVKRQCKRSVSLAAKLPSGRKPASVTLLTISCSSGRANASRTAGHCVSATEAREIAPTRRVRSTGAPCASPRSTRVNSRSWALMARAWPCGVLCTTTMRPRKAPSPGFSLGHGAPRSCCTPDTVYYHGATGALVSGTMSTSLTSPARESRDSVVIRFAGDSGDGMQVTGGRFTVETALAGNDLTTFPDYPAEIRAPAGTTYGVSAFQIHFGAVDVMTPGDQVDVLVAMNPAALKVDLKDLRIGGTVVVDTGAFTERNLAKAGFTSHPLEDGSLAQYQ